MILSIVTILTNIITKFLRWIKIALIYYFGKLMKNHQCLVDGDRVSLIDLVRNFFYRMYKYHNFKITCFRTDKNQNQLNVHFIVKNSYF